MKDGLICYNNNVRNIENRKPILKYFLQVHCQSAFTGWLLCARNLLTSIILFHPM